ncbi:fasciclin domain-containing protein [Gluconobacter sp. Dm-62]|uniref:fasciclin domain-containing protein n=1 Tax=Gluconobacter sp. Dm-62 TaxID=2799804 RepID=UPI001B8D4D88|nr:fasciclin domain-containing protein [Gluconobacter sp. Dm-62]MBS1104474.1 fasciclin domain-containing protein [Gluconobacter sp. Dm-62]
MDVRLEVFSSGRFSGWGKGLKLGVGLLLGATLSACGDPDWQGTDWTKNYQDSFETQISARASMIPGNSDKAYQPSVDGTPNSPVAYHAPPVMSYEDRPLDENISGALELADYVKALRVAKLDPWISGPGPYTLFAIPNAAMERLNTRWPGGLLAPGNRGQLVHILGYTIAKGKWDEAALRRAIRRNHGHAIGLKTLYGDLLGVQVSPRTGELLLENTAGETNRLSGKSFPQSNGVLYITQDTLLPVPAPEKVSVGRKRRHR